MKEFLKIGHLLLAAVIHSLIVSSAELSKPNEFDPEKALYRELDTQNQLLSDLAKRSLKPEEIMKLEIDAVLWQRLRYAPDLQPIVEEVQQDIIKLKWGENVATPAWKKYGEKAYPLLDYYSQSSDYVRQRYGYNGIRSLGKPYTTKWLEKQIERNPSKFFDTTNALELSRLTSEFGLDDPVTRDRLVKSAKQHVDPTEDNSFDYRFLEAMSRGDTEWKKQPQEKNWEKLYDEREKILTKWKEIEATFDGTVSKFEKSYAHFKNLSTDDRARILYEYQFDRLRIGQIPPFQRMFLHKLSADLTSELRGAAILELERHGDPVGKERIDEIIDADLSKIPYTYLPIDYLKPLLTRYPESRFSRGCREYEDLTGKPYFKGFETHRTYQKKYPKSAPQRIWEWEDWLYRYPDHPGADDAAYLLIQAYYENNDVMSATRLWIKMLSEVVGDGDVSYSSFEHLRTLLDVGLSIAQIEELLPEIKTKPILPIFKYALAVKYARIQNYDRALQFSQNLDRELLGVAERILKASKQSLEWRLNDLVVLLPEQRQRWQKLLQLQQQNTPESRYQIASNWAIGDGYKNGYMGFWNQGRRFYLHDGIYSESEDTCKRFWVCDLRRRSAAEVRAAYQLGNQNAVAVSLYQKLLDDPLTPESVREKTLFMMASTLLRQYEKFPIGEHMRMHPLAGVKTSIEFWERGYRTPILNDPDRQLKMESEDYSQNRDLWEKAYKESKDYKQKINNLIHSDYQRRIGEITDELKKKFPKSVYIDDLLFAQFFLSDRKDSGYLKEIVEKYPNSDYAREAKFLLDRLTKGLSIW